MSQVLGCNSKHGAPCNKCNMFLGEVQGPMSVQRRTVEPRLWESGRHGGGGNCTDTYKGLNQALTCKDTLVSEFHMPLLLI